MATLADYINTAEPGEGYNWIPNPDNQAPPDLTGLMNQGWTLEEAQRWWNATQSGDYATMNAMRNDPRFPTSTQSGVGFGSRISQLGRTLDDTKEFWLTMLGGAAAGAAGGGAAAAGEAGAATGATGAFDLGGTYGGVAGAGGAIEGMGGAYPALAGGAGGFSPFVEGAVAAENPYGISTPGASPMTAVPGGAAVPSAGLGGAAGTAAAGTALSRIIDGTATTADWTQVLGTAGATGLGMYSANERQNAIEAELARNRAERAPFLQAGTNWLNDPNAYMSGPGQSAMNATLQGLSVRGNPLGSGTSLGIANQAALGDWRNAWSTAGNLGLGGQDTRANLAVGGANAGADVWGNLAGGISDIINPRKSLADYMREYKIATGG